MSKFRNEPTEKNLDAKVDSRNTLPQPRGILPAAEGAKASTHSVVFLHNSYYHFFYLAQALRKRGWDAISVSIEAPDGPNALFYHGEDVNLFQSNFQDSQQCLDQFLDEIPGRFKMLQFAGDGQMSCYPWQFDSTPHREVIPSDFIKLKELGVKIGYTISGCNDGIAQSSYREWSGGMCDKCALQGSPESCSNMRNLAWGHKREMFCDLNSAELLPALDFQNTDSTFREPLTMCLDPVRWSPDIEIPPEFILERSEGELLIYHAVGNYYSELLPGRRDVKGTKSVIAAVERLQQEGLNVRLIFKHDVPSVDIRFYQVQADIVVDQLNTGRYGANARECLMLGKPVVGHIISEEPGSTPDTRALSECPIMYATEETVYGALLKLCETPELRASLSIASREYALRWHAADACAERFEQVYDGLMMNKKPVDLEQSICRGISAR